MDRASCFGTLLAPVERLHQALLDPARRERTCLRLMLAYAAVWALYGAIAKSSQDLHFDLGEQVGWSREIVFGSPKHPPLPAWLVGAWFAVFPLQDWAYYLLGALLAAASLWIAWRISAHYLDSEKRPTGLVLLTLVPFYNFHALKLNSNALMTVTWALATWAFLRSRETLRPYHAALAGLAAAVAMLDKYWSIFLLLGFAVAALVDADRRRYFGSLAPWITIGVGLVALAPHILWLSFNGFGPFQYAMTSHVEEWPAVVRSALSYIEGAFAYVAAPILLVLIAARPGWRTISNIVWPGEARRQVVLFAFLAPLVLPMVAAVLLKEAPSSLWTIGSMTLLPIVLLSSPLLRVGRAAAVSLLALGLAFPLLMVLASPVVAIVIHHRGVPNSATHYSLLANQMVHLWQETSDRPLKLVGGSSAFANGTVFYLPDKPSVFEMMRPELTPWVDDSRIARQGLMIVCRADDSACNETADRLASRFGPAKDREVTLSRIYFGTADRAVRYRLTAIPPRSADQ